jgi:hypothetical protein
LTAVLKPYYYFAYAVRRLLGADVTKHDFNEWRAMALIVLVQLQLVAATVYVFFRPLLELGTAVGWAIATVVPLAVLNYLTIGNARRYLEYANWFDKWSVRKRTIADVATLLIGVVSIFSLILVRSWF